MSVSMLTRTRERGGDEVTKKHAGMGAENSQVQSGNSQNTDHRQKLKNKTLKKAKTNSNELASVTTKREVGKFRERKKKETWKD